MKILIIFAHPKMSDSIVQTKMLGAVRNLEGVTIHDIYAAYPDFLIDVDHEQELLLEHDLVVLQHPFYWYSAPAIIKEWLDLVLEHDWAYGARGTKLHGKFMMQAISTGGPEHFSSRKEETFEIRESHPFNQTAHLWMAYRSPSPFLGPPYSKGDLSQQVEKSVSHYSCAMETCTSEKHCLEYTLPANFALRKLKHEPRIFSSVPLSTSRAVVAPQLPQDWAWDP